MKIYTKTGDSGETSLLGGKRISKDSLYIEALGSIDELNSTIGVALPFIFDQEVQKVLTQIQNDLLDLGSSLAQEKTQDKHLEKLSELEKVIDSYEAKLPELHSFILPQGDKGAAFLHLSRGVCRRAERRIVALALKETVSKEIIPYLNRLSDLLFVLARYVNHTKGVQEQVWQK